MKNKIKTLINNRLTNIKLNKFIIVLQSALFLSGITLSCVDEEFLINDIKPAVTRSELQIEKLGGLIQQTDKTWMSQKCRVPIVGNGRVVTSIGGGLVQIAGGSNKVGNAIDMDLSNYTTTSVKVIDVNVYTSIISIKDLNHTYSAGQKVGFIYKETGGELLKIDVLNGMVIQTYLNGNLQETVLAKSSDKGGLNLNVLSVVSGDKIADRELSFMAAKEFDEVRLCTFGVKADILNKIQLAIKYAFVGENPMIRATREPNFKDYWTGGQPSISDGNVIKQDEIVDEDITNGAPFTSLLGVRSKATVNFNRTIPIGSEIGYCYSFEKLLDIGLLLSSDSPTITSKDSSGKEVEASTPGNNLLSLGVLKGQKNAFICMIAKKECSQLEFKHPSKLLNLGGMKVHYAFVREPVKLDPTNFFSVSSKEEIYNSTYKLKQPIEGSVQYEIMSSPTNTNPGITKEKEILYGMTEPGDYIIKALYTGPDGTQVEQTITITKKKPEKSKECNIYITGQNNNARIDEAFGPQGGISVIASTNKLENIIDTDYDNYATFIGVLNLLEFKPVAAITLDPITTTSETRIGFEVQAVTGLLDLSAVNTYQVKVYNGKEEVKSSLPNGYTVNVGVLNFDNSRVRLSVNIPPNVTFDHIELWRKGLLGLLEAQKIYNVFYENTKCVEDGANEACMEVMTNTGYNLNIDYDNTQIGQGIGLLEGGLTHIDKLLDGDLRTYAEFNTGIGVGEGATISLTFDEQQANQPIGFVLGNSSELIKLGVLNSITLKVFNGNKEIASKTDFSTADIELISRNGKIYLEIPANKIKSAYNRIEITIVKLVTALSSPMHLCGVYTRFDSDGDGIPDCSEDQVGDKLVLNGGITHICEGDAASLKIESSTLNEGAELFLDVYNRETGEVKTTSGILQKNNLVIKSSNEWMAGRYYVDVKQGEVLLWNHAEVYAHPTFTTWKPKDNSTDWNNWDNWEKGSPWGCTNVVLPSGTSIYPILKDSEGNMCNYIYFEPGAELENTPAFSKGFPKKVFIDTKLEGGKYNLFSAPLEKIYTGDMFVSNINPDKFEPLNETTYPEQRFLPTIYQRFWSKTVPMVGVDKKGYDSDVRIDQTDWSRTFNAIDTEYQKGQGFSIRLGKDGEKGNYTFRFPKEHTTYNYFYANGVATGDTRQLIRSSIGQFIKNDYNDVKLSIEASGNRFLLGNPFMTHLDIKEFLKQNSENVSAVEIYNGSQYVPITLNNGSLLSNHSKTPTSIAPMEAIFVQAKISGTSLVVKLTKNMFHQKMALNAFRSRFVSNNSSTQNGILRINAILKDKISSCVVLQSQRASDSYNSNEDVCMLIDNEVKPEVAVYTVADRKALAIQRIKSSKRIPLGIYIQQTGNVKLEFENISNYWNGWMLYDSYSNKKYSLRERVLLDNISSVSDRFYLIKE